ncbi:putative nuclease HARBI1 [Ornithodoros turicata]|uniref:putative nuclease HARBI1 n=1 Tax=Ornithodoros turicata TaxID=34597 RepID=UPI003139DF23
MVHFPRDEELQGIEEGFGRLARDARFSGFVGAIDGTHVRIVPPKTGREDYINRKKFASIQMQAIVDHECFFLDIFVGYPGSVHDSRVLRNSPVYREAMYPPRRYALLGDLGYPCLENPIRIITPYKNSNGPVQSRFNRAHARARSVVDRAFGRMKGRWRSIFTKALEVSTKKAPLVIAACAAMHNVCIREDDIWDEELVDETHPDGEASAEGVEVLPHRDRLAAHLSCPSDAAVPDHDYHATS